MSVVIRVEGLNKTFSHKQALLDLALSVEPSGMVALIGASGSGKSTITRPTCCRPLFSWRRKTTAMICSGRLPPSAACRLMRRVCMIAVTFVLVCVPMCSRHGCRRAGR